MRYIEVVNQAYPEVNEIVNIISRTGIPRDAEVIYKGPRNTVYRFNHRGYDLTVKAFGIPNFINKWVYAMFRDGKAKRSYLNSEMLNKLGFHSPEPIGYSEERVGGKLHRSYYTCLYYPSQNMRDCDQKPDAEPLLKALAEEMVKLHRAGVWNKDFSPGNILYNPLGGGKYTFSYVDVNRMKFNVFDRKKMMRNFRALSLNREQLTMLARFYGEAAGENPDDVVAEAIANLEQYEHDQRRKRRFKSILKKLHLRK